MNQFDHANFAQRLARAIADGHSAGRAVDLLRAYMVGAPLSGVAFDGSRFQDYGLAHTSPNEISPADLVAVTCLSMDISRRTTSGFTPQMAFAIEESASHIASLLASVPHDRELHTLSPDEFDSCLGAGSPADELWYFLRRDLGLHRVATYKLLARKRPHLLPVRDSVADAALGAVDMWWQSWWEALSTSPDTVARLVALRGEVGIPQLSLLGVADIIIWMRGR